MALENQGTLLGKQQQELLTTRQTVANITTEMQHLRLDSARSTSTEAQREPRLPAPPTYAGEPGTCRSFLSQCSLIFELQASTFSSERSRVAYVITLLTGRAREWGTALWEAHDPGCYNFDALSKEMKRVFDRSHVGREQAVEAPPKITLHL